MADAWGGAWGDAWGVSWNILSGATGRRRKRRLVVEIDGQFFDVRTPQEAARLLAQAAELAEETPPAKPAEIKVRRGSGGESVSVVVKDAVRGAQKRINEAIRKAASARLEKQQQQLRASEALARRTDFEARIAAKQKRIDAELADEEAILVLLL